jgi:hypothetical protein
MISNDQYTYDTNKDTYKDTKNFVDNCKGINDQGEKLACYLIKDTLTYDGRNDTTIKQQYKEAKNDFLGYNDDDDRKTEYNKLIRTEPFKNVLRQQALPLYDEIITKKLVKHHVNKILKSESLPNIPIGKLKSKTKYNQNVNNISPQQQQQMQQPHIQRLPIQPHMQHQIYGMPTQQPFQQQQMQQQPFQQQQMQQQQPLIQPQQQIQQQIQQQPFQQQIATFYYFNPFDDSIYNDSSPKPILTRGIKTARDELFNIIKNDQSSERTKMVSRTITGKTVSKITGMNDNYSKLLSKLLIPHERGALSFRNKDNKADVIAINNHLNYIRYLSHAVYVHETKDNKILNYTHTDNKKYILEIPKLSTALGMACMHSSKPTIYLILSFLNSSPQMFDMHLTFASFLCEYIIIYPENMININTYECLNNFKNDNLVMDDLNKLNTYLNNNKNIKNKGYVHKNTLLKHLLNYRQYNLYNEINNEYNDLTNNTLTVENALKTNKGGITLNDKRLNIIADVIKNNKKKQITIMPNMLHRHTIYNNKILMKSIPKGSYGAVNQALSAVGWSSMGGKKTLKRKTLKRKTTKKR